MRDENTITVASILQSAKLLALRSPEEFGDLVVMVLRTLADFDSDAYELFVSGIVSRELRAAGLKVALEQTNQALSLGRIDSAEERVTAISEWVSRLEALSLRLRLQADEVERIVALHHFVM